MDRRSLQGERDRLIQNFMEILDNTEYGTEYLDSHATSHAPPFQNFPGLSILVIPPALA